MAQITVTGDDGKLVHREWVLPLQIESDHFLSCLAERLRWAIRDTERVREGNVMVAAPSVDGAGPMAGEPVAVTADPAIDDAATADIEEHVSFEPVLVG
jgi:hypothetical protein